MEIRSKSFLQKPAGCQRSAWKTITEVLCRAERFERRFCLLVSNCLTLCLFTDTKADSCHVLIYVAKPICLELSQSTKPPLVRERSHHLLSRTEQDVASHVLVICVISHFKPNLIQTAGKKMLKPHSCLTFPFC